MNPREERAERKSDRREAISRRVVGEIKFCSQNCLTAPWLPPFFLTSMHASYALTSVSKSDLAQAKDSRAFFASSRLSIGEVKRGFDDSKAAIVRTGISWFSLRDFLNGLSRSRLTRVQTFEDRTKNKHFSQTQVYWNSAHLRMHDISRPNIGVGDYIFTHMSTKGGKATLMVFSFNRTKILKRLPCSIDSIQFWRINRFAIVTRSVRSCLQ